MDIDARPAKAGETTDQFEQMEQAIRQTAGRLREQIKYLSERGVNGFTQAGYKPAEAEMASHDLGKAIEGAADLFDRAVSYLARAGTLTASIPASHTWTADTKTKWS